jgi:hypothetical protein
MIVELCSFVAIDVAIAIAIVVSIPCKFYNCFTHFDII